MYLLAIGVLSVSIVIVRNNIKTIIIDYFIRASKTVPIYLSLYNKILDKNHDLTVLKAENKTKSTE